LGPILTGLSLRRSLLLGKPGATDVKFNWNSMLTDIAAAAERLFSDVFIAVRYLWAAQRKRASPWRDALSDNLTEKDYALYPCRTARPPLYRKAVTKDRAVQDSATTLPCRGGAAIMAACRAPCP
jgi:hypothetical protein